MRLSALIYILANICIFNPLDPRTLFPPEPKKKNEYGPKHIQPSLPLVDIFVYKTLQKFHAFFNFVPPVNVFVVLFFIYSFMTITNPIYRSGRI